MKKNIFVGVGFLVVGMGLGIFVASYFSPTLKKNELAESRTLPSNIHPDQVTKVIDGNYAIVVRPSVNVYLPNIPSNFEATYRGVLRWDKSNKKWEEFLMVQDTDTKLSQSNNPVDLWFEYAVPHLLVSDVNGAGSGEGLGKVLVPVDSSMSEWKVVECFDFAFDTGKGKIRNLQSKECQAVKVSLVSMAL